MHAKEQKFIRNWPKQRQKGKTSYVMVRGIVWGIIAASLTTLFRLGGSSFAELYLSTYFVLKLTVMIAVGIFFQNWQWNFNNARYDKLLGENEKHTSAS